MLRGLGLLAVLLPSMALGGFLLWPRAELAASLAAVGNEAAAIEAAAIEAAVIEAATTVLGAYFGEHEGSPQRTLVAAPEAAARASAERASEPEIRRWVEDLRDDGIAGNALRASQALQQLGEGRVPSLEAALQSFDLQQRQFAAAVLRNRCRRDDDPPSGELLRVCVEGLSHEVGSQLRDDSVASASARFLVPHADPAQGALRRGLGSGDAQLRFLSAFLLAGAGMSDDGGLIVRELVHHLGDNEIAGDALMAAHGLYRLGEAVLPVVRLWRPHVDAQARSLLDLVELDLLDPPKDRRTLYSRRPLHAVTGLYHDPVVEFDLRRSPVASFGPR